MAKARATAAAIAEVADIAAAAIAVEALAAAAITAAAIAVAVFETLYNMYFFLFFSRYAWVEIGPAIIHLVRLGFRRLASLASSTLERVCSPRTSSLRLHPIKNPYEVNYRRPYLDPCVSHCGLI